MGVRVGGETASPATPRKRKGSSDEGYDTPSKKKPAVKKATPKNKVPSMAADSPVNDIGGDFDVPRDAGAFVKQEEAWEQEFA